jgi:hypothetical protein
MGQTSSLHDLGDADAFETVLAKEFSSNLYHALAVFGRLFATDAHLPEPH